MSGRKQKTERKKAAVSRKSAERRTEPKVFFEDALLAFLRAVGKGVGEDRNRGSGAQALGAIAVSVCATEALDLARKSGKAQDYISATVYSLVAAMIQGGAWNLPLKPTPEQAPEPQEKPSEPPKKGVK